MTADARPGHGRRMALYFLAALAGTAANFVSRFAWDALVGFSASLVLAYYTGLVIVFVLSKHLVFDAARSGRTAAEFLRFFAVSHLGLAVTFLVATAVLTATTHAAPGLSTPVAKGFSHAVAIGASFVCNYAGHAWLSFRDSRQG